MEKKNFLAFLMFLAVAAAACVSSTSVVILSDGTLEITKMEADPDEIFIDGSTNLYVDIANNDIVPIDVSVNVFEPGFLEFTDAVCEKKIQNMQPKQLSTLRCAARARQEIVGTSVVSELHAQALFAKNLQLVQSVEFISPEWYERQKILGMRSKPKKYAYADKNVKVTVEFSDEMPLVVRPDKKYYMYITAENIGRGTLTGVGKPVIKYADKTLPEHGIARDCVFEQVYFIGRKTPRIACELALPNVQEQQTADLIMGIEYNYDIRASTSVKIKT